MQDALTGTISKVRLSNGEDSSFCWKIFLEVKLRRSNSFEVSVSWFTLCA